MSASKLNKTEKVQRSVASGNAVGGAVLRLPLNKESLIAEHKVLISVSQANAGVVVPTLDVRKFIKTIELQTSDGKRFTGDGAIAYDLGRLTESPVLPVSTLVAGGTSTAAYSFDLHHENDGAYYDLLTAIEGALLSQLDLVIEFSSDADNGFVGQTAPAVATYAVNVESSDYPAMANKEGLGTLKHFVEAQTINGATTGRQSDVRLAAGNATRFITLHAYNMTTGVAVPSDAVLDSIKIVIGGQEKRVQSYRSVRDTTAQTRGLDVVGFGVLDWGDDEGGFLDLNAVNDPRLQLTVAAGAPASWRVVIGQDYTSK